MVWMNGREVGLWKWIGGVGFWEVCHFLSVKDCNAGLLLESFGEFDDVASS
jgi:hypothetical protein